MNDMASAGFEHFAIEIAPTTTLSFKQVVDWPLKLPHARLVREGSITVHGQRRALYFVPYSNDGSIFMHHLVCIWTQQGHTFVYGFHVVTTRQRARALDEAVLQSAQTVEPS